MFCIYCGAGLPDTARFCARCGRLLPPAQGTAVPPAPPAPPRQTPETQGQPGTEPSGHTDAVGDADDPGADESGESGTVLRSNVQEFRDPEQEPAYGWYPVAAPEPTVSDSYAHAWQQLKPNFWPLLGTGLVWALIESLNLIISAIVESRAGEGWGQLYDVVASLAFSAQLGVGLAYAFLRAARGEQPDVGDLFTGFRRAYAPSMLAAVLYFLLVLLGMLLLVVPGIIAAVRLAFYPYLLADEGLGAVEALRESWRRTSGYGWTVFGVTFLTIPIVILGLLALLVGIIPAFMWVQLAIASLFYALSARRA